MGCLEEMGETAPDSGPLPPGVAKGDSSPKKSLVDVVKTLLSSLRGVAAPGVWSWCEVECSASKRLVVRRHASFASNSNNFKPFSNELNVPHNCLVNIINLVT